MKAFAVLAFFAIVAYASAALTASGVPQYDGPLINDSGLKKFEVYDTDDVLSTKPPRVICNLGNFGMPWFSVNEATCSGICVDQGYKNGGQCDKGVCQCRPSSKH